MNSMNQLNKSDVAVVGGGLSGLVAAATVAQAGRSVTVYEARGDFGGQARSVVRNGFTLNQGPHALYRGLAGETILTELGVDLLGGEPPIEGSLVFGGQVEIAPAGPSSLLRTKALSLRGKLQIGALLGRLPKVDATAFAATTVNEWISQLGLDERPEEMVRALVRLSTYVNQPDQLSADVAIEQMQSALRDGVLYLHHGWQSIVDQLRSTSGIEFVAGTPITELPDAPAVIVAVGGPPAATKLLGKTYDAGPPAHVACLDLGLSRPPERNIVIGGDVPFYFSNHSPVAKLAPVGHYLVGAMQYLGENDEPNPAGIRAFADFAGIAEDSIELSRSLHKMTAVTAIPTASRGGLAGRPKVTDTGHDHVFVAGDWVGPVGHLADASIASGQRAAAAALGMLGARPVGVLRQ